MSKDNTPCLFDYATSELSQDAFIAWLLKWSDDRFSGSVHDFGRRILLELIKLAGVDDFCPEHLKVEVCRQHHHIDVFCEINDSEIALIIEDKINASQHGNQLERYRNLIESQKKYDRIVCVYLKTGDQSNYEAEKKTGFTIVTRGNLYEWFELPEGEAARSGNKIVDDFVRHINGIDELVGGYKTKPLDKWDWNAWKGFYMALQGKLENADWDYVANPAGGFMGFWWGWRKVDDGHVYLQLEEAKACFKVEVSDDAQERKSDIKYNWNDLILKAYDNMRNSVDIEVARPPVLRDGHWMTVAIIKGDYRAADKDGRLDMAATVKNLAEMQNVLDNACSFQ